MLGGWGTLGLTPKDCTGLLKEPFKIKQKNSIDLLPNAHVSQSVLRIRDVYPESEFFPSRIRMKEFMYYNPKKLSEIWSGLFIPDPCPDFLPIPDPRSGSATLVSVASVTSYRLASVYEKKIVVPCLLFLLLVRLSSRRSDFLHDTLFQENFKLRAGVEIKLSILYLKFICNSSSLADVRLNWIRYLFNFLIKSKKYGTY